MQKSHSLVGLRSWYGRRWRRRNLLGPVLVDRLGELANDLVTSGVDKVPFGVRVVQVVVERPRVKDLVTQGLFTILKDVGLYGYQASLEGAV